MNANIGGRACSSESLKRELTKMKCDCIVVEPGQYYNLMYRYSAQIETLLCSICNFFCVCTQAHIQCYIMQ